MCGICEIINPSVEASSLRETMRRMLFLQRHRGPDDSGYYADASAILGHVRRSIQDLSEAGSQPMVDRDNRFVLVYNGEIYNVDEHRRKLAARGN